MVAAEGVMEASVTAVGGGSADGRDDSGGVGDGGGDGSYGNGESIW